MPSGVTVFAIKFIPSKENNNVTLVGRPLDDGTETKHACKSSSSHRIANRRRCHADRPAKGCKGVAWQPTPTARGEGRISDNIDNLETFSKLPRRVRGSSPIRKGPDLGGGRGLESARDGSTGPVLGKGKGGDAPGRLRSCLISGASSTSDLPDLLLEGPKKQGLRGLARLLAVWAGRRQALGIDRGSFSLTHFPGDLLV